MSYSCDVSRCCQGEDLFVNVRATWLMLYHAILFDAGLPGGPGGRLSTGGLGGGTGPGSGLGVGGGIPGRGVGLTTGGGPVAGVGMAGTPGSGVGTGGGPAGFGPGSSGGTDRHELCSHHHVEVTFI